MVTEACAKDISGLNERITQGAKPLRILGWQIFNVKKRERERTKNLIKLYMNKYLIFVNLMIDRLDLLMMI